MSTDDFGTIPSALDSPIKRAAAVTPSDTTDLTNYARALWIGTGGDVKVTTIAGDAVTLSNAVAGSYIPIRVKLVWSTGTTASDIVALW